MEHVKHDGGQVGQIVNDPAGLWQQVGYMFITDAKAIHLITKLLRYVHGMDCCVCTVGYSVSNDENDFSLFLEKQHCLHDPPQGRSQRGATGCIDVEAVRYVLAVPHDGEYRTYGSCRGKSRDRWIDAFDILQCFCHSKARLLCQNDGYAAHAAADIQQDMHSSVEASLFCLPAENARIARLQPMERAGV